ncbi:alkyl/aryl-sulfatase [Nocardia altamirensis]|uniref:alkyl/aryl-sulfatase n=1 Tax=Nocardia altamirensis TaxID=472158 RepID=UPI000840887A|nr:alkyl sulfatase dimerization domain-containing protein [Nocardia altamirensis]
MLAYHDLLGTLAPCVITNADDAVVWEMESFGFLAGARPATVHPGLWRLSRRAVRHGLYQVCEGIYQVRGFDVSNMTFVESDRGVIVIDPLTSTETAAAALRLYRRHRGERAVVAVVHTHSHGSHGGGVLGVVDADSTVPIIAPTRFLNTLARNVSTAPAVQRRGAYCSGAALAHGPRGKVDIEEAADPVVAAAHLLAPTLEITDTGMDEEIDGIRMIFQLVPGTEWPAEMNVFFPCARALFMADQVGQSMSDLVPLRGGPARDARMRSRGIAEAIELFADDIDVVFAAHHWPSSGRAEALAFLRDHRDMYAYLHDQTVRRLNQGYTGIEIAEELRLSPRLTAQPHTAGRSGSLNHNVKAISQHYLGWYDGNPAHLWLHPPRAQAARYVALLGGVEVMVAKAREFAAAGDLRFAAELGSHAVFADPENAAARATLAAVFERLGNGAECASWRNCYLSGAAELRSGRGSPARRPGVAPALGITQLFDTIASTIDGPRAWSHELSIRWVFTDSAEIYHMELSNGALIHHPAIRPRPADLEVTLTKPGLLVLLDTGSLDHVQTSGDTAVWSRLLALTDAADPDFPIVTP